MIHSFLVSAALLTTQLSAPPSIGLVARADSSYTLSGNIKGLGSGWVYLRHLGNRSDSVRADHDKFVFAGLAAEPEFCALEIRTPAGHKDFRVDFFLQSGQFRFEGNQDVPEGVVITGGTVQEEYQAYQAKLRTIADWTAYRSASKKAEEKKDKARIDSLGKAAAIMNRQEKEYNKKYATDHPASYIAVWELYVNFSFDPDMLELGLGNLYNGLDTAVRASYFGWELKAVLDGAERTAIGHQAPDFTQNDMNGKPVALSSFKGKYVLVDFWASWCGPCREENPAVVKAYRQYHTKGFAILGVSLDEKKDKWAEAVRKDRLEWMQVSDLKGWQNSAAELYGVKGIPMNYLLDKDGKIIARGLRGEELEKKLEELVH
jgi:peroxiredoxin